MSNTENKELLMLDPDKLTLVLVEFGTHCLDLMERYDAIVTHDGHENAEKYLTENFVSSIKGTMKVLKEMKKGKNEINTI